MADFSYQQARRLGLKEYKARTARHEESCLTALEDLLPKLSAMSEQPLGVTRVDIEQIAGSRSRARREDFSASFYPLLDENSEFAAKWSALAASHLKEGIREPIVAVEYLNRYYVVEGHKRVSVLRYFGAGTVRAEVRRVLPARSEEPEIAAYYEFLDFYRMTFVNYIVFRTPGRYPALRELLCGDDPAPWDGDRQRSLFSDVMRFRRAFRASELSGKLDQDEALLRYLQIYGYARLQARTPNELRADLAAIAPELLSVGDKAAPVLMTAPAAPSHDLLKRIVHPPAHSLKAAFLHDKSPESSPWTLLHEQGRLAAQEALAGRVETRSFFNMLQEDFEARVKELAGEGYDLIFSTSPRLLARTLTAAAAWPELKFLNCSLNVSHPLLRCYYGRMYEAKFLTGLIAGAASESGRIGYVCDYPIYGMPASVNAFALGARAVNPRARVFLRWSTVQDGGAEADFAGEDVRVVSEWSELYPIGRRDGGAALASSRWDWGCFYRKILESVLDGSWSTLNSTSEAGQSINYWWGLSVGAVDVSCGASLPAETRRLFSFVRGRIADGSFHPFEGPVYDQSGTLRIAPGEIPTPERILHMDWLADNVAGGFPQPEELTPDARELVRILGFTGPERA